MPLLAAAGLISQSTLSFAAPDAGRIAVIPLAATNLAIAALLAAAVLLLAIRGASLLPASLLILLALPWLPFPVPAAFLTWTGPAAALVWTATLLLMAVTVRHRGARFAPRRRPALAAGIAAFVLFSVAAWRVAPMHPGGDEPHYLVITQSLLLDRDLQIENNHARGDYRAYFAAPLRPDFIVRGRTGAIYSIHAPGIPALVLPAFAAGGYPGVVVFLLVLSAAGSALAWHLAWLVSRRHSVAWAAWASVTLPVTTVFQSFTVYPDGVGGLLTLSGAWALLRAQQERESGDAGIRPWFLHGAALAALPWMHTRFAVLAATLGSVLLLRLASTRNSAAKAVAFLSVPAVSALAWVGYFVAIYGTPDPSAPYGRDGLGSFVWVPGGLAGLFFDQRFGLLLYAPVLLTGLLGAGVMLVRAAHRRLALELLFVIVPYVITVTHYPMWWGGWSAPARFFAPVLLLLVVPSAVAWASIERRSTRVLAAAGLAFTAWVTAAVVFVDRGRLAFNVRDTPALWLEWLGPLANLVDAAPSWSRTADVPLFRAASIWIAAVVLVWLTLRWLERRATFSVPSRLPTAAAWLLAVGVMSAMSVVWRVQGADGRRLAPAQVELLKSVAAGRDRFALDLETVKRVRIPNIPGRLRIEMSRELSDARDARDPRPLFTLPTLPAGEYRLRAIAVRPGGMLAVGVGRDQFALSMQAIESPPAAVDLTLPVPVRALTVRGDEEARQAVRGLIVEPLSLFAPDVQQRPAAQRAVRYGAAAVFFTDDGVYPEPEAFWIAGGASTSFVVSPADAAPVLRLLLRNAPVPNRIALRSGSWAVDLPLGPGEERTIEIPRSTDAVGVAVAVRTETGFRPSEHDAESRDARFLGVWLQLR